MSRVYVIVDEEVCRTLGLSSSAVFRAVLEAEVKVVQYRAKGQGDALTLEKLKELVELKKHVSPLTEIFANDRPDLAELAGTDGVHVGQSDMSLREVRAHFPRLRVGVSTHNARELEAALDDRPDYVAIGPVFETTSKKDAEPTLGLFGLAELAAHARATGVLSVAIGGITQSNIGSVLAHADCAATISEVLRGVVGPKPPYPQIALNLRALEAEAWNLSQP
jgi:thiamine-phosphate pyrophosphorylase